METIKKRDIRKFIKVGDEGYLTSYLNPRKARVTKIEETGTYDKYYIEVFARGQWISVGWRKHYAIAYYFYKKED